jgi:rfaE bifunctional protein kinase chain/domain
MINIAEFKNRKILVIGDLMIDEYLWGSVERISPEAPVQIVEIIKETYTLGGAGNVVNNLVSLGADVFTAGVIGEDSDANLLINIFNELNINTNGLIKEKKRPTTKKTRVMAANQHVLRIDRETKDKIPNKTIDRILDYIEDNIPNIDIIIISDYGKGVVSSELVKKTATFAKKYDKMIMADPKGDNFKKYSGAYLITPNKKEASIASKIKIKNSKDLFDAGKKLINSANFEAILITCGKEGIFYLDKNGKSIHIPAQAKQVFDVSGAGDTVIATLALSIASGASFEEGAQAANIAGGIVVGKVGTASVLIEELMAELS